MLNILRSIPWAFRITLHTAPIPFLAAVCTTLLLTFMPSAQVVLVNAAVGSVGSVASGDTAESLTWVAVIRCPRGGVPSGTAGEHVALHHDEGARECRRASEAQYHPGAGESRGDE